MDDPINSVLSYDYSGTISMVFWVVLSIIIFGTIIWFVWYKSQFNKKIVIRDETAGGSIVRFDSAREFKDKKSNNLMWQLWSEKITMPPPPKEAISIGVKGKKIAELVRIQSDQYHWVNIAEFKQDAMKVSGKFFIIAEDAKRQLADQLQKAQEERSTKLSQMLTQLVPLLMVGICILGAYFIFDVISTKMAEVSESVASVSGGLAEVSKQNAELIKTAKELITERETQQFGRNITYIPN